MALEFPNEPFHKEQNGLIAVWLQGRDTEYGAPVECRVIATALTRRGAGGLAPYKLENAFNKHREQIEAIARRKYAANEFERLTDRIVVWINDDDFRRWGQ